MCGCLDFRPKWPTIDFFPKWPTPPSIGVDFWPKWPTPSIGVDFWPKWPTAPSIGVDFWPKWPTPSITLLDLHKFCACNFRMLRKICHLIICQINNMSLCF
jgi:hypothetical protein